MGDEAAIEEVMTGVAAADSALMHISFLHAGPPSLAQASPAIGFRVWDLGLRVRDLGFSSVSISFLHLGFRVSGLGFRV